MNNFFRLVVLAAVISAFIPQLMQVAHSQTCTESSGTTCSPLSFTIATDICETSSSTECSGCEAGSVAYSQVTLSSGTTCSAGSIDGVEGFFCAASGLSGTLLSPQPTCEVNPSSAVLDLSATCISDASCTSPTSVQFEASCIGGGCTSSGATSIIDEGASACPASMPALLPASCGTGSYTMPVTTPCLVATTSGDALTVLDTVSSAAGGIDNICGYSTATTGQPLAGSTTLSISEPAPTDSFTDYINGVSVPSGDTASATGGEGDTFSLTCTASTCPCSSGGTCTAITWDTSCSSGTDPDSLALPLCSTSGAAPCLIANSISGYSGGGYTFGGASASSYPLCFYADTASAGWVAQSATLQTSAATGGGGGASGGIGANLAIQAICNVYTIVNVIVFILALTLMILGGAIYAGAQILPGQARGQVQAYAMGMIMGGVAGAIIAVLAPFILSIVYNAPSNAITAICST